MIRSLAPDRCSGSVSWRVGLARGRHGGGDVDARVDQERVDRVDVGADRGLEHVLADEAAGVERAVGVGARRGSRARPMPSPRGRARRRARRRWPAPRPRRGAAPARRRRRASGRRPRRCRRHGRAIDGRRRGGRATARLPRSLPLVADQRSMLRPSSVVGVGVGLGKGHRFVSPCRWPRTAAAGQIGVSQCA